MKRILIVCAVTAGLVGARAASPAPVSTNAAAPVKADELFANVLVAKGKGFEITRAQLDNEMIYARSSAVAAGREIPPAQMAMIEKQLLQQLIFLRALGAKATDADKAAGQQKAGKQFEELMAMVSTNAMMADQLDTRLKSVGLTRDELRKQWVDRAIADAVVRRELNIKVTDEDVKNFYTNNPAKFEEPEQVHVAHLLLMTKDPATGQDLPEAKKAEKLKQIQDILKRARSGENFSNLVEQFTDDAASKPTGGEYLFPHGKMVPEFEAAAFSLRTNQISDVVTTVYGYHIIKMLGKIPASKVELAKIFDDLKEGLTQQEIIKQLPEYMKKVQKDADVKILDESLKPLPLEEEAETPATPATIEPK